MGKKEVLQERSIELKLPKNKAARDEIISQISADGLEWGDPDEEDYLACNDEMWAK